MIYTCQIPLETAVFVMSFAFFYPDRIKYDAPRRPIARALKIGGSQSFAILLGTRS